MTATRKTEPKPEPALTRWPELAELPLVREHQGAAAAYLAWGIALSTCTMSEFVGWWRRSPAEPAHAAWITFIARQPCGYKRITITADGAELERWDGSVQVLRREKPPEAIPDSVWLLRRETPRYIAALAHELTQRPGPSNLAEAIQLILTEAGKPMMPVEITRCIALRWPVRKPKPQSVQGRLAELASVGHILCIQRGNRVQPSLYQAISAPYREEASA